MSERAVLYLHGACGTPADFDAVEPLLGDVRCVAPALALGSPSERVLPSLVSSVREALDEEEIEDVVALAHSFGGAVALAFARAHPERVRGLVLTGLAGFEAGNDVRRPEMPILLLAAGDTVFARHAARQLSGSRVIFLGDAHVEPVLTSPSRVAFHLRAFLNDVYPPEVRELAATAFR
jgi:pimeloyl-ACP methyl ester carboxylesterase